MSQHHGARRSSTQLTLQAAFSHAVLPVLPTTTGPIDVVDLFCGVGGFSEGARLAGHRVVLAVDSNECALDAHKLNHPSAVHELATLPAENLQQLLPSAGTKWHLHGSPPCTKLSRAGGTNRSVSDRAERLFLVNWFLNFVAEVGCTTWSMEQVAQEDVLEELAARKKATD
jgi:site-specific DNA-cytosine methylase